LAALPDVIGSTIGQALAGKISREYDLSKLDKIEATKDLSPEAKERALDLAYSFDGVDKELGIDRDSALNRIRGDASAAEALARAAETQTNPGDYTGEEAKDIAIDLVRALAGEDAAKASIGAFRSIAPFFNSSPLPPIATQLSLSQETGFNFLQAGFDALVGVGSALNYIEENINSNPFLSYSLLAVDIAAGPVSYAVREAVMASPIGDIIETGVDTVANFIFDSVASLGLDPNKVFLAASGTVFLGTVAFGARAALKHFGAAKAALLKEGKCFIAGTLIATANGQRPIETIAVGDLVLARNEETGETGLRRVVQLFVNDHAQIWDLAVAVAGEAEEHFGVTAGHPWRIAEGKEIWLPTSELRPGMQIARADGPNAWVVSVSKTERTERTFNFEVEDFHTYFVGENALWVHNTCSRPPPNGNSLDSTNPQHGYEIYDTKTGDVVKTGVSGQPLRADETSPRAAVSVRRFNREEDAEYDQRIVAEADNRRDILEWETQNANRLRAEGHSLKKHKRP
jgi:hypothetical protein